MVAHVAVILSQRNAGVDGCLTRGNRHVGGVGDQHGTIHQALTGTGVDQLAEFLQRLCHLVAALAAADIDDDVRIAPFCNLVLGHRLAGAKAAGDGRRAALGEREHRINDALAGDERPGRGHALGRRARGADRPLLAEGQRVLLTLGIGQFNNRRMDGIAAVVSNPCHGAGNHRRHHAAVLDGRGLGAGWNMLATTWFVFR